MPSKKPGGLIPSCGRVVSRSEKGGGAVLTHEGEQIRCNLCGSDDAAEILSVTKYRVAFKVVRCKKCGLAYINPRIPASEINRMYSVMDTIKLGFPISACGPLATNGLWHGARHDMMLRHLSKPGSGIGDGIRYLDIGCGLGNSVEFAGKRGWDAVGIDISELAVAEGRKKGRNLMLTDLAHSGFEDDSFDVMLMSEVIEHVNDPLGELRLARGILKKGGILAVDTINIDSVFMKILGENSSLIEPGHITYFNYRTLREMLEKAGFRIVRGFRGLEISLRDYARIYSQTSGGPVPFALEMGLAALRKIGIGDVCFGGICYYVTK